MNAATGQWVWGAGTPVIFAGGLLFLIYINLVLYHLRQTGWTPMRL